MHIKFTSRADDIEEKLDKEIAELHKKIDRVSLRLKIEILILLLIIFALFVVTTWP